MKAFELAFFSAAVYSSLPGPSPASILLNAFNDFGSDGTGSSDDVDFSQEQDRQNVDNSILTRSVIGVLNKFLSIIAPFDSA